MKAIFTAAVILGACVGPLCAQPAQADRTVSWYVNNPTVLARVTAACRNDPGHGRTNPDCINADAARLQVGANDAQRAVAAQRPDPLIAQTRRYYCSIMKNPIDRSNFGCGQ